MSRARVVSVNEGAANLRRGGLTAFATETVYGLGAHALDEAAVRSIFATKGRPLTDPVIVHVAEVKQVAPLVQFDGADGIRRRALFDALAARFWPGPMTIVTQASAAVPTVVTAGSGYVGVRCPGHERARALIAEAGVPVAAPSANRFGHVSPTTAAHVLADLGDKNVCVIDGGACGIGIESTVVKLVADAREVVVLREGHIKRAAIEAELYARGHTDHVVRAVAKKAAETEAQVAPGQMLRHYAPDRPTFLLRSSSDRSDRSGGSSGSGSSRSGVPSALGTLPLGECAVIDFAARNAALQAGACAYRDLSPAGDHIEAATQLYTLLRWSEDVAGARAVLLTPADDVEGAEAVADRLFRAASGESARVLGTQVHTFAHEA